MTRQATKLRHARPKRPKLGLGTVQMGMNYGITNDTGKVPVSEACHIIEVAVANGIDLLDTAVAYGDSEEVIGHCLREMTGWDSPSQQVKVVTKTPVALRRHPAKKLPEIIRESALHSCRRLGVKRLHGLLVHHVEDLLSPVRNIIRETLLQLRAEGIIEKVGFSAYEAGEIHAVLENFKPDIVQLPFNAVDRRLIASGTLSALRQASVEVHARSLFLQGLLLQPADRLKGFFAPLSRAVQALDETFRAAGLSRLAGLLATVWQSGQVDRLIVGVANRQQMKELLTAIEEAACAPLLALPEEVIITDTDILNPSLWPRTEMLT